MAQKIRLLIALTALSFQWAAAQEPTASPVAAKPSATPQKTASVSVSQKNLQSVNKTKELEQSPQFKINLERWNKLSKAQQDELRQREKIRSERILNEINDAIIQTGLKLDAQQRQIFTFRYAQERRSIEERIQKEMEQKRNEAIARLIRQLADEFQPIPPPPPHPGPDDALTAPEYIPKK